MEEQGQPWPPLPERCPGHRYRGGGSPRPQLPTTGPRQSSASSSDTASLSDASSWSSEDARPHSPCWGTQVRPCPVPQLGGGGMPLCLPVAPSPPHRLRSLVAMFATLQDPVPPAEGCCHPAQHCCKRKLPAFPPEVTSNAPSGARSPAGEGSGDTPALLFSPCPPPPFSPGVQGSRGACAPLPRVPAGAGR